MDYTLPQIALFLRAAQRAAARKQIAQISAVRAAFGADEQQLREEIRRLERLAESG